MLILNRKGVIKTRKTTRHQCKNAQPNTYNYEVKLHCRTKLDKRGFLIDHHDVHAMVAKSFRPIASCEVIAMRVGDSLMTKLKALGVIVSKIEVEITPKDSQAKMTYITPER